MSVEGLCSREGKRRAELQRSSDQATPAGPRILVVDDDLDTLELISFNLIDAGYQVSIAVNGNEGLYKAQTGFPHLMVLDLMLPDIDGFNLCRQLRGDPNSCEIPIIILTARTKEADRVSAFELGANDYVSKPFSPRELLLRIKNLISRGCSGREEHLVSVGDLSIDLDGHSATLAGTPLSLTLTEFRLLATLAQQNGRVQSREQLLEDVWQGDKSVDPRTVDTHMARLREKLGRASGLVDTVYGVGYRFVKT